MITVAIATRTLDRQRRYRSLLPVEQFTIVSALDCPTLSRLVKSRPVDVIVFDIQRPAMPVEEWLNFQANDPDLGIVPIAWVGRDVSAALVDTLASAPLSLLVPPRPDSQVLVQAITTLAAGARSNEGALRRAKQNGWEPGEDIIENALSIFDGMDNGPLQNFLPVEQDEWLVSEMAGGAVKNGNGKPGPVENNNTDKPSATADESTEESSITLDSEEIDTGSYGVVPRKRTTTSHPKLVNEKIMETTTNPGGLPMSPDQIERMTREILDKLAVRLAGELVSRIDPQTVRRMIEQVLAAPAADSPLGPPNVSS
jgi:hypothetical protein